MADAENSKAVSAHSDIASSASHSTSVLNSKKTNNKVPNPAKPTSPTKSSPPSAKTSQPFKPTASKSTPKASALSGISPVQKSSPLKNNSVGGKRLVTTVDPKNASEQKQASSDASVVKKASGKVSQQGITNNVVKSRTLSIEKLTEASSANKITHSSTKSKTQSVEKLVEAFTNSRIQENVIKSKTRSSEKLSEATSASKIVKAVNPQPEKNGIKNIKTSSSNQNIDVCEGNLASNSEDSESFVTSVDGGKVSVVMAEREDSSKSLISDKNTVSAEESKNAKLNIKLYNTDFSKNLVMSDVSDKIKTKEAEDEEEEEDEGYIIVNPGEEKGNLGDCKETYDLGKNTLSEKFDKSQNESSNLLSANNESDLCENKSILSNKEISIEKCMVSDSFPLNSNDASNCIDLQGNKAESVTQLGSVQMKSSDLILTHHTVANINACSLSGDNNAFNSISEASSDSFSSNTVCNIASDNYNNTSSNMEIISNDCPAIKDVSDPISTNHLVTKSSGTSKPDVSKVNGDNRVNSEPSCKSTDDPIYNSQVSSKGNSNSKGESASGTIEPPPEESKHSIRLKVWDLLEKNNHVLFPRPCKGRIPHFVGSPEAADRLATLDDFKKAQNVKVNPDKPQAHVRFLTLEAGKNLLVPIPRLRSGLFKRIIPPAGATKEDLKTVVTQQGVLSSGQALGLDDKVSIDLVVMGAVAVSKEGHRIGKGAGYSDLEFGIMMKMGAITQDTVVITTVHDEQVFDTLPHHLFKEHDVPVDFIVTPTKVYEVKPRLPKPAGIIWNILSNRRLQRMPILNVLRDKEIAEGKECHLKEVDSDPEDWPVRPFQYFRRGLKQNRRDPKMRIRNQRPQRERSAPPTQEIRPSQRNRQSRTFRRKPAPPRSSSAKEQPTRNAESGSNNKKKQQNVVEKVRAGGDGMRPLRRKYFPKPKAPIAFSIRVSGISKGTRVRDLKTALNERGVVPYDITWQSHKGRAVLHFSRMDMYKDKEPLLLSELSSVDVVEGFPAKLEIKLPGNARNYRYEWCVNGKPINMEGRSKVISRMDGTAALIINNVSMEDAGEYTVTVRNKQGEITSKGSLSVAAKAKADTPEVKPSFLGESEEVSAERYSTLLISLSIAGNPVPDIEWSKDGVALTQNDKIQFLCDGNKVGLKINHCRMNDSGEYKCKLKNHLGEAEMIIKATVAPSSNNQINNVSKVVSMQDITMAMDDIIATLRDLKVKHEGEEEPKEDSLSVEPANSVSRIESTGISAV